MLRVSGNRSLPYVSDRKDFYHEVAISEERSSSNRLPFSYPLDSFRGTWAYDNFLSTQASARFSKVFREATGDKLAADYAPAPFISTRRGILVDTVTPAFGSLLEGDDLGVEFALLGHQRLLESHGALASHRQLLGSRALPLVDSWQALVIDDLVAKSLHKAATAYQEEKCLARLRRMS